MADTFNAPAALQALLKVYYKKNGVENLMFRNSPVVKEIKKEKIEGKTANFAAMIGRGGAVGADFIKAKAGAGETASAKEFAVKPGQIFSVYSVNAKDVLASQSNLGGYMKIAGANMFAANEAFRKTLAVAFYGRGYGELCKVGADAPNFASDEKEIIMPTHAIMGIDIGTKLVVKTNVNDAAKAEKLVLTVTGINGNKVKVKADRSYQTKAGEYICLDGSVDEEGSAMLPMGLGGWLPTVAKRTGGKWDSYAATLFYGVNRKVNPDRLCGAFYDGSAAKAPGVGGGDEKKSVAIQKLLQKCRRQGSMADLIVMNDEDFMDFAAEIESTNTFFTQTSTKAKKNATVGMNSMSASFSTNYIENIYDDPYCPKGTFYVLDKEYVALWAMTNTGNIPDGISGNNPGKADPMEANNDGHEHSQDGLLIDDWLNIQPGADSINGPSINVALQFFGTFAITNPSVCGVGLFAKAEPIEA